MNSKLRNKFDLKDDEKFTYHYKSADDLLNDFKEYIVKYKARTEKRAKQYITDIRDVWGVDQNLCLHPNLLKEPELVEERFFLSEKSELIENMGKEVDEQTVHIQAITI